MAIRRYRGFVIRARPYQLHQSKEWTADLVISRQGRNQPVGVDERFASQEDAELSCARLGQRIIDGEVPGWSVDRIRGRSRLARALAAPFRDGGFARPFVLAGLLVALLGGYFATAERGFSSRRNVLSAADMKRLPDSPPTIPPWVGGVVVALGAGLMVMGARKGA